MPNRTEQKPAAAAKPGRQPPFEFGGITVAPGGRATVDLPLSLLSNHTPVTIPVRVLHGRRPGAQLFVSAAVHGDEINGVEIIRRLLKLKSLDHMRGTLLAVPVVNAFGFIGQTRYLPDRRDLNRCFPGVAKGSLAAQIANLFMTEIVARCSHGIDLHTGSNHRTNLPQIRGNLSDPEALKMAEAFAAPAILDAPRRSGSLRGEASIPVLVYEAGEALRFDEAAISIGVRGLVRVMEALGMIQQQERRRTIRPFRAEASSWVRSPLGGVLRAPCRLGSFVHAGDRLGIVADPFGETEVEVVAKDPGVVIGRLNLPVVNQGDALFHVAKMIDPTRAAGDRVQQHIQDDIDREFQSTDEEPD
ncbi:MAG: succinylglutamate desuccinylase/aspartoacylase family protein [Inquilinus sp.]|nr:succinylglutamate desuccinylase/aspartoacylase family protein [Inquilinus sp.]